MKLQPLSDLLCSKFNLGHINISPKPRVLAYENKHSDAHKKTTKVRST